MSGEGRCVTAREEESPLPASNLCRVSESRDRQQRKSKFLNIERKKGDERGQVLVVGLLVALGLVLVSITVANVGIMVAEKIHLQDTVDAAAYSAATVQARYMNLSSYVNRAMVANYNSMAFNTALWATIDADDHGTAVITDVLYKVSAVLIAFVVTFALGEQVDQIADIFRDYVHGPLHTFNYELNELFAQDDDAQDLNKYIEMYNVDVLSMYQGFLFAAMQSSRHQVAQEVARKMDPKVLTTSVLGLGAEAVSYDELARAVDFVIRDINGQDAPFKDFNRSFNEMAGTAADTSDHKFLLAAVTEASLDKFAAGYDRTGDGDLFRQFNTTELLPDWLTDAAELAFDIECYAECAACVFLCDCNCGSNLSVQVGSLIRPGQENKANETRVPIIARRRMREVNLFGISITSSNVPGDSSLSGYGGGTQGHTSGDTKNDVANFANLNPGLNRMGDFSFTRAAECFQTGCTLNALNQLVAASMFPGTGAALSLFSDDHWDGTFEDIKPVDTWQLLPPVVGQAEGIEYVANVIPDDFEEGVPKYDWLVDLDNVGFPLYHYPQTGATERISGNSGGSNNNYLTGPSVAVYGVKKQEDIKGIHGLGIGNEYSLSALSRAQVYYLRNPNRPLERPNLFNPHWVARLAPIDSEDSPPLLRDGLSFVGTMGIPIRPTH